VNSRSTGSGKEGGNGERGSKKKDLTKQIPRPDQTRHGKGHQKRASIPSKGKERNSTEPPSLYKFLNTRNFKPCTAVRRRKSEKASNENVTCLQEKEKGRKPARKGLYNMKVSGILNPNHKLKPTAAVEGEGEQSGLLKTGTGSRV